MPKDALEALFSAITKIVFDVVSHHNVAESTLHLAQAQAVNEGKARSLNALIKTEDNKKVLIINIVHNNSLLRSKVQKNVQKILQVPGVKETSVVVNGSVITIKAGLRR